MVKGAFKHFLNGTWNCMLSIDHTTIHSDLATEFTYGFPSDIPKGAPLYLMQMITQLKIIGKQRTR